MFEFGNFEEIREIDEIDELDSNTSNGYKYTSAEVWKMGRAAIEKLFEANKDILFPEVEKDLSNEGVLRAETKAQAQAQQQSYDEKYRAAMQAAQELAASGYYTLEQAIQIVMANL